MANTKKHIYIMDTPVTAAAVTPVGTTGLSLAAMNATVDDDATSATVGQIILNDDINIDAYADATAQITTITPNAALMSAESGSGVLDSGENFAVTLINVTEGREVFPRRTYEASTVSGLVTAINNDPNLNPGDGLSFQATATSATDSVEFTITSPENVVIKVAVNDGADATISENSFSFSKGYTSAEAIEYIKDLSTQVYGRTNRVGFPIVEPDFGEHVTAANDYSLLTAKVRTTRFDKNFGAGYVDEETFYVFIKKEIWTDAGTTAIS